MSGIIGRKIGMTNFFEQNGKHIPCTIIQAGPCVILQIKNIERDGYNSIQLGFEDKIKKKTSKPLFGHFKKVSVSPKKKLAEFKCKIPNNFKIGQYVDVNIFTEGDLVDITSVSKGKGFQGVVKRHGFSGVGQSSHGQHNRLRSPGSIGAGSDPSRVFKGMLMGGRMGGRNVTIHNLRLLKIDIEKNLLLVKGSISGYNSGYVLIRK
ncbi:50S ribosomal protein L3 [Candidatus Uzinura diaspidicola str. ASNER]|uniref:Large ribosomal subunit protein uL3 n=1 Tax=Candidatus Uzinura diaspidicola str. ASNER TaxID=1133592 RepID=L7VJM1_9FLAO|nr:50S ribosomal protein L3 [Candidatus Uzinura diaspidicola str. ASNER]